jgi:hypothetical protein
MGAGLAILLFTILGLDIRRTTHVSAADPQKSASTPIATIASGDGSASDGSTIDSQNNRFFLSAGSAPEDRECRGTLGRELSPWPMHLFRVQRMMFSGIESGEINEIKIYGNGGFSRVVSCKERLRSESV